MPTSSPSPRRTRTRARRGDGELLRDELLDAAEALLVEHGAMDAVSIRAVASAAGVSPPAVYLHFADKDELFYAVCERRFADFDGVLAASTEGIADPVEALRAMGAAYVRYGVEHATHYQLIFGPRSSELVGDRDVSESAGVQAFGRLVTAIGVGMDAGVLREQDAWLTAFAVWSACHGAVMIVQAQEGLAPSGFPVPDVDALAAAVCDTVLDGLVAR